ncbi:uncharacterized protein [Diadema antillarum]|uniref:uncharacterized protein n=1 Tax=Diadema antillarum TaxID=105358 RepID=UPI003A86CC3C
MAEKPREAQGRWTRGNDRSRRDEIRYHPPSNSGSSAVVYRQKKPGSGRRKKVKKRWSVRPDVSLVVVPRKKQCQMICSVVMILLGGFLTLAGLIVLVILAHISKIVWGVGIGVLVLGVIVLVVGLVYLLCVCCFKTSTKYKEYMAEFRGGDVCEIGAVADDTPGGGSTVTSDTTLQTRVGTNSASAGGDTGDVDFSRPEEGPSTTYVTANEDTPTVSKGGDASPDWHTPMGYRPLRVNTITDFSANADTSPSHEEETSGYVADQRSGLLGGNPAMAMSESEDSERWKDDFAQLEEALQEMIRNKSDDQEIMRVMEQRPPMDTSTPVTSAQRTFNVPISVQGSRTHVATPPNPTPPSYDHVIKNYRSYSRSTSPTRLGGPDY